MLSHTRVLSPPLFYSFSHTPAKRGRQAIRALLITTWFPQSTGMQANDTPAMRCGSALNRAFDENRLRRDYLLRRSFHTLVPTLPTLPRISTMYDCMQLLSRTRERLSCVTSSADRARVIANDRVRRK
jgi:hypothetical protein